MLTNYPQASYNLPQSTPNTSASANVQQSNAPINASQLGTTAPQIPQPVNNNQAQMNLGAQTTTFTESIAGNQQAQQEQAQAQQVVTPTNSRQGILDKISQLLGVQSTQGADTQQIYADEGVFEKKQLVTKLEGEALAKDRAYQKQADKIRANAEGKFGGAVEQDLANLERQRNDELADIAIQSKIAMGNYADASAIAEAKIKAKFEPIENQIKSLQNLYQLYADDMTESEKMIAQEKMQEKRDAADFARQKELIRYKAQIELGSAGGAGLSEKDRLKISQNKSAQDAIVALNAKNLLDRYNEMVRGFGRTPSAKQRKQANSFLVNILAPKLSVALGQGGMTGDEAKAKIESLGLKGISRREKVTWNNIESSILGMKSIIDTSLESLDSAIPGASDTYDIFAKYKVTKDIPKEDVEEINSIYGIESGTTEFNPESYY